MEIIRGEARIPTLSRVQLDALRMVSNKMTLGEIMDALRQKYGIGEKAVDRWLQSAMRALQVATLPEAAEIARSHGLLDLPEQAVR